MSVKKIIAYLSVMLASLSINAQHFEVGVRGHWHGGDIRHFERHDRGIWRGGHWRHTSYGGRLGWWWIVGPSWYYYSRPIYPYPDPYVPPVVIVEGTTSTQSSTAQPPVQNWYYCEASNQYYPYVDTCPAGWKTVPATPPKK